MSAELEQLLEKQLPVNQAIFAVWCASRVDYLIDDPRTQRCMDASLQLVRDGEWRAEYAQIGKDAKKAVDDAKTTRAGHLDAREAVWFAFMAAAPVFQFHSHSCFYAIRAAESARFAKSCISREPGVAAHELSLQIEKLNTK